MSDCRASLSDANRHINTALQRADVNVWAVADFPQVGVSNIGILDKIGRLNKSHSVLAIPSQGKKFFYDERSTRAVCNFADEHLWFDSGFRGIGFCKLLRDNRRRVSFA